MCGITGIFNTGGAPADAGLLLRMTQALRHRGPDGEGYFFASTRTDRNVRAGGDDTPEPTWKSSYPFSPRQSIGSVTPGHDFNLAFGHRRLSIIDLSPAGHQPMCNADGSLWIVYNGEIYNYIEIREELKSKGYRFATATDTEVILHAYREWGRDCLQHFNGMWAFAIWDRTRGELFCSRDRFGVKPFHYFFNGSTFVFASEIKSLLLCPFIPRKPDDATVYRYLAMGMSEGKENTFYAGISQLEPGHYIVVSGKGNIEVKRYYTLQYNAEIGSFSESDLKRHGESFISLLRDSIRLRLRSDVPIGSCLSGGLDSSTIVCVINALLREMGFDTKMLGERQKVFSSCYDNPLFDERRFINEVTSTATMEAHCVFPSGESLWQELDALAWHQDEPFGSTSIYAQWNVMRLARQAGVKVLLDGQGGDELLGGYHSYYGIFLANLLMSGRVADYFSEFIKARMITGSPYTLLSFLIPAFNLVPAFIRPLLRKKLGRTAIYTMLNDSFVSRHRQQSSSKVPANFQQALWESETGHGLRELLRYEDRNSMAFSIETRTPFIDYRLVDYVFSLPACYKIHGGWTKYLLRSGAAGLLPEKIRWRRDKMGFPTPEKLWLKQSKSQITGIFSGPGAGVSDDYINRKNILNNLDSYVDDRNPTGISALWRPINLQIWLKTMFP